MSSQNHGNSCYKSIQAFGTGSAFDPKKIQLADSTPKNNSPYLHTCFEIPISELIVPAAPPQSTTQGVTPLPSVADSGILLFLLTVPVPVNAVIISASMKMNKYPVATSDISHLSFGVALTDSSTQPVNVNTSIVIDDTFENLQNNPKFKSLSIPCDASTPYLMFALVNYTPSPITTPKDKIVTVTIDYYLG